MSRRPIRLSLGLLAVLLVPVARGEDARLASDSYTIKLERPSKVGDKADVSITATSRQTTTVSFDDREPEQQTKVTLVVVEGRGETLAVDAKGNETKASLKLAKAQLTEGDKTAELLPKGTVLIVELKPDGGKKEPKTTFSVDGAPVNDAVSEALSEALSLHDPRTSSDDAVFVNQGPKKVGDTWPLNPELAAKDLTVLGLPVDAKHASGKTTLVGTEDSNGVPCLHLQLEMDADDVKPDMGEGVTVTKGSMQLLLHAMVPVDANSQYGVASLATRVAITAKRAGGKDSPAATVRTVVERGRALTAKPVK